MEPPETVRAAWLTESQIFDRARPLLTLVEVVLPRDSAFVTHGESVGHLAAQAGEWLGLPRADTSALRLAGLLHDIGKVAIPDRILGKAGPLTEAEWAQVRRHPEVGCRLIRSVGLDEIADWVHAHHERPDGRGYPRGLPGDAIPPQAAVLAVADAYQAMREDRPYCRGLSREIATAELRACSGGQFDPSAVEAVIAALAQSRSAP